VYNRVIKIKNTKFGKKNLKLKTQCTPQKEHIYIKKENIFQKQNKTRPKIKSINSGHIFKFTVVKQNRVIMVI
jgi:hypothetical protein